LPARAVLALAGDGADLVKGGRVDEPFDALAHREPAPLVLAADFFRPAHAPRHALARPQLFQFPLPTHPCLPEIGAPLMALWQRIDEYRCVWPFAAKGLRKLAFSNALGPIGIDGKVWQAEQQPIPRLPAEKNSMQKTLPPAARSCASSTPAATFSIVLALSLA